MIDVPHISNFTDFDALAAEPDVAVRMVRDPARLGGDRLPDALILPGSKNTLGDLAWLRETGLASAVSACAASGRCQVVGVCAGMQMLGDEVRDPLGLDTGLVWGSYLHGLFDADLFRRTWLDGLRLSRGLAALGRITPYDIEPALDRLADVVERSLDMDAVSAMLRL